jgi:hypothetical protein
MDRVSGNAASRCLADLSGKNLVDSIAVHKGGYWRGEVYPPENDLPTS